MHPAIRCTELRHRLRCPGSRRCPEDAIGQILQALQDRDLLGAHRLFTTWLFLEQSVRVPLVIRPPDGLRGTAAKGLAEHVDVCATLRDVAGAAPLPDTAGRSLRATVFDGAPFARAVVCSECGRFGMWRTDRYKLVVDETTVQPSNSST